MGSFFLICPFLCHFFLSFCHHLHLYSSNSALLQGPDSPFFAFPPLFPASVLPCFLLFIFHPDAMLLINSIRNSFVTVWETHTKNGSILCSDTLRKQPLNALSVLGRPEKTFCHASERLSFNGNSEVNKVVPVAIVIQNTLCISASSVLDSLLDSEGQPKVTRC